MNADVGGAGGDVTDSSRQQHDQCEEPAGRPGRRRRASGVLEAEVLEVLQRAPEALTAGQVKRLLGEDLAYSTIVTTLARLHDKRVLTRVAVGRAFAYRPAADPSGLTARRMHQVLADGPDRAQVLTSFVGELAEGDAALLRTLLQALPQDGSSELPERE
ncbi:BlaI/MecI/CopY family transcriptional regulator [Spirillospora sp. NPDC046719]